MKQMRFPGFELQARRDELGLTVDDIYRKLRIPAQTIRLLEAGDLQKLPAACYTVGFLRSYCDFLGLDAKHYIAQYHEALLPQPSRFLRRRAQTGDSAGHQAAMPAWARDGITWATVLGLVALGWVAWSIVFQPASDPGQTQVQAGVLSVPTPPVYGE